jgi:hypothetical protein
MDIYKPNIQISPETILSYVSQEEIMYKYLNISAEVCGRFCSPLRKDENPTCTLTWINGKLLFRDWAEDQSLDCFGVVMKKYNVGFYKAQEIVANDFDLIRNISDGSIQKRTSPVTYSIGSSSTKQKSNIEVKTQPFTNDNIAYLKSYYITSDLCKKYNVVSPKYVWINGNIYYYQKDNSNPAIAYYFGKDEFGNQKWKIYFYKDTTTRFITNTNRINGWVQIPDKGSHLIITKSLKDVMVLDKLDIPAVAMQAESQTPYDYIIKELQQRFTDIISLFDYDKAGITRAEVLFEEFDIPYFFIQDSKAKDISDYIKEYGYEQTKTFLNNELCLK